MQPRICPTGHISLPHLAPYSTLLQAPMVAVGLQVAGAGGSQQSAELAIND
jgi:hypothetical protein